MNFLYKSFSFLDLKPAIQLFLTRGDLTRGGCYFTKVANEPTIYLFCLFYVLPPLQTDLPTVV